MACAHNPTCEQPAAKDAHQTSNGKFESNRAPSSEPPTTLNNGAPWSANDPALKSGELTIWKLQQMAQTKQFDELNRLFDHGLSMDRLPTGYAAGRGARVLGVGGFVGKTLVAITGGNWYGKLFFNSKDPASSHGLNRIRETLGDADSQIRPIGAFTTKLMNPGDLKDYAPTVNSNFVILNYSHPVSTTNDIQEKLLKVIPVYDVMVAVPGKYGPVYVGKTWLGHYDKNDDFHALNKNKLIAWYFLDFNPAALTEQINRQELKIDTNSEM